MNLHYRDEPCPCPWCSLSGQRDSLHRIRRVWMDDSPPSAEAQALMDEIVRDALRAARQESDSEVQR